jgi:hypothetical protein
MAIAQVVDNMKFIVYMHILPNGKRYIGITSTSLSKRCGRGSGYKKNTFFWRAIQKYKWENIKHIILYQNLSKEEACEKEKELIAFYKSNDRNYGYNCANGGEINFFKHCKASEETKKKMSEAQKKRYKEHPLTEEQKAKKAEICRENAKKRVYTPEMRKKMSDARKGKPNYSARGQIIPDWQKKLISEANSGANSAKARKVICLDTLKVYDTIRKASLDTGCTAGGIGNVCRNVKIKTHNFHWAYYDETKDDNYYQHLLKVKLSIERPPLEKQVRCIETGKVYPSMKAVRDELGIQQSVISCCCNGKGKTAGGYHWEFA